MRIKHHYGPALTTGALLLCCLPAGSAVGRTQLLGGLLPSPTSGAGAVTGQAAAAQVTLLGLLGTATSASLASTGISSTNAESDLGQAGGSVLSVLSAEVPTSATYSYADQVDSAASLGNLAVTVAGVTVAADSVVAEASQVLGAAGTGTSYIGNLTVNGIPIAVTGAPNQTIPVAGGQLVLNEQTVSSSGAAVVNALHMTINGVADVVVASATAAIS
jgi:hypothetical protein